MVQNAVNVSVLLVVVLNSSRGKGFNDLACFNFILIFGFVLGLASLGLLVAYEGSTSLLVVADEGQASGKGSNGVTLDEVPLRRSYRVKPGSPVSVTDSRGSESNHLDIVKNAGVSNVDIAEAGQGTTKTDTGDDKSASVDGLPEPTEHIGSDGVPHPVEFPLHLATLGSLFVLGLNIIINLPG